MQHLKTAVATEPSASPADSESQAVAQQLNFYASPIQPRLYREPLMGVPAEHGRILGGLETWWGGHVQGLWLWLVHRTLGLWRLLSSQCSIGRGLQRKNQYFPIHRSQMRDQLPHGCTRTGRFHKDANFSKSLQLSPVTRPYLRTLKTDSYTCPPNLVLSQVSAQWLVNYLCKYGMNIQFLCSDDTASASTVCGHVHS